MDTTNTGTPKLNEALAKAQQQMRSAAKDSLNPHFKSRYADLSAVWEAWREVGPALGLAIIQTPVDGPEGKLVLETVLLHSSGEERRSRLTFPVGQQTPQGYGSALTYARRYALSAMVGIVADEDDDGNEASKPSARQPLKPVPAPAPTPAPKAHRMRIEDEPTPLDELRKALQSAPDMGALTLVAAKLASLPEADKQALRPVYNARVAALGKAGAR